MLCQIKSATLCSGVFWPVNRAFLVHVCIWLDRVEEWKLELVVSEKLAVREFWISSGALGWESWVAFKDSKLVDITWAEFSRVEFKISENAASLPNSCYEGTADH